ncbi:MAG: FABP family protein [Acidobacteria bacterium]|nr:FABP family protein [Acidobacteriota bacterium]
MYELDASLPAEIVPLSWLLGIWEGSGIVAYKVGDETREYEFGQRVAFTHDGTPHVQYSSSTWLFGTPEADTADDLLAPAPTPLFSEIGYWRLSRPLGASDAGPGMLPGLGEPVFVTASEVETLRTPDGAFELEVSILHPGGVSELYLGQVKGPRIDLVTDAVVRTASAKEYAAATRLYGLVDEHLLWAWDIAALGQDLRTHASGRLARVD